MTDYTKLYQTMHSNPKRFPGYSIKSHLYTIATLVEDHNAKTLLDYGCGKGYQYLARRYHETWGGILPHCYDPGVSHLDKLPEGTFNGVICTDVLEHVPEKNVPELLSTLQSYATQFVFMSVALYPSRKKLPNGENCHITVKDRDWWVDIIQKTAKRGIQTVVALDHNGYIQYTDIT